MSCKGAQGVATPEIGFQSLYDLVKNSVTLDKFASKPHCSCEQELWKLCTQITVGDWQKTNFWKDNWLQGSAPMDIAPDCYKPLCRCRAQRTLLDARPQTHFIWNCTAAICRTVNTDTTDPGIQLTAEEDTIGGGSQPAAWHVCFIGSFSAYNTQFRGSHLDCNRNKVWKAHLLQWKLPTANRIQK